MPLIVLIFGGSLSGCAAVPEGLGIVFKAVRGHPSSTNHDTSQTSPAAADGDRGQVAHAQEAPADVEGVTGDLQAGSSAGEPRQDGSRVEAPEPTANRVVTLLPLPSQTPIPTPTTPPTSTPPPLLSAGVPLRMEIPAIGVDSSIEQVGLTPDRAMDVPKAWMNGGWYRNGYLPGETGNAVIAGHLDTSTGGPAVFWDLNQLVAGDEIYITYEDGSRLTFVVEASKIYEHNAQGAIIDSIFGKSLTADLNLVTCDGAWDDGAATYAKRLVVFTTLVPERTIAGSGNGAQVE